MAPPEDAPRRDVVVLGGVYVLLFTAYSGIQNVTTTLHPAHGLGSLCMGIIYAMLVATSPLAPWAIQWLGLKRCILLSILGYWQFVLANWSTSSLLLALSSAWLGASAGTLWVSQAIYVVRAAEGPEATGPGVVSGARQQGQQEQQQEQQQEEQQQQQQGQQPCLGSERRKAGNEEQGGVSDPLQSQREGRLGELSGLFWGLYGGNQILGNLVTFLVCSVMQPGAPHHSPRPPFLLPQSPLHPLDNDIRGLSQEVPSEVSSIGDLPPSSAPVILPATTTALLVVFGAFMTASLGLAWGALRDPPLGSPSSAAEAPQGAAKAVGSGSKGGVGPCAPSEGGLASPLLACRGDRAQGGMEKSAPAAAPAAAPVAAPAAAPAAAPGGLCSVPFILGMIPLMSHCGLQSAFIAGDFTRYAVAESLGPAWIRGSMVVFGITNVAACLAASYAARGKTGHLWMLALGLACQVLASTALALPMRYSWALLMAVAGLWGVGDAALQSQINALLPILFPCRLDAAIAQWRMWSSGAAALLFWSSPSLGFPVKVLLLLGSALVSLMGTGVVAAATGGLR